MYEDGDILLTDTKTLKSITPTRQVVIGRNPQYKYGTLLIGMCVLHSSPTYFKEIHIDSHAGRDPHKNTSMIRLCSQVIYLEKHPNNTGPIYFWPTRLRCP